MKVTSTLEARALADGIEAMMPRVRITELLHEVNRTTGFASAFTNLRTGEQSEDDNALLAAILADATNLGLGRMAAASHGVTRDKLVWTAEAYIRPETYKAALAKIIDAITRYLSPALGVRAPPHRQTGNSFAPVNGATPLAM